MFLKIYKKDAIIYLELGGRIILEQCDLIKDHILNLLDENYSEFIVDLKKVSYLDSAGLGMLVGFKMTSSKNKINFSILSPSKEVFDILEVSKLTKIFPIKEGYEAEMISVSIVKPNLIIKEFTDETHGVDETISHEGKVKIISQSLEDESLTNANMSSLSQESFSDVSIVSDSSGEESVDELCKDAVELLRKGDYNNSIEKYKQALELDPNYVPALNNLAIIYEKKSIWYPKSIELWERLLKICQKNNDSKHVERAEKHLTKLRSEM